MQINANKKSKMFIFFYQTLPQFGELRLPDKLNSQVRPYITCIGQELCKFEDVQL